MEKQNQQKNKVEQYLSKTIAEFTLEELNTIFYNLYDTVIYEVSNEYFIDIENTQGNVINTIRINKNCSLFFYLRKIKVCYQFYLENKTKVNLYRDFKNLFAENTEY